MTFFLLKIKKLPHFLGDSITQFILKKSNHFFTSKKVSLVLNFSTISTNIIYLHFKIDFLWSKCALINVIIYKSWEDQWIKLWKLLSIIYNSTSDLNWVTFVSSLGWIIAKCRYIFKITYNWNAININYR